MITFICSEEDESQRLDRYLKRKYQSITQGFIEKHIRLKSIIVNGQKTSANYHVLKGDKIDIYASIGSQNLTEINQVKYRTGFLEKMIIFEDDNFCIINKPQGIASQGGSKTKEHIDDIFKPYKLVHRLDKETSGAMILAKNLKSSWHLQEQFNDKKIHKNYLAVVLGIIKSNCGEINAPLKKTEQKVMVSKDGHEAITKYKVIERAANMTLVEFSPITGRTHQIRVHSAHIGHPILGDSKYSNTKPKENLHLHSKSISFLDFNKNRLTFKAKNPKHICNTIINVFKLKYEVSDI